MNNVKNMLMLSLGLALIISINGCGTMTIAHEYDPRYDFSNLKTYAWISNPDKSRDTELAEKRIKEAIDDKLAQLGYRQSDDPDFKIAIHLKSREKIDLVNWGYGYGWRGAYGYGFQAYQYQEGSLLVDIVDANTSELVWQGLGRAEIKDTDPEIRDRNIRRVLNKLFKDFPPKDR